MKQEEDGESPAGSSARKCDTISQDPKLQMVNGSQMAHFSKTSLTFIPRIVSSSRRQPTG